jgi:hypothetical protein
LGKETVIGMGSRNNGGIMGILGHGLRAFNSALSVRPHVARVRHKGLATGDSIGLLDTFSAIQSRKLQLELNRHPERAYLHRSVMR